MHMLRHGISNLFELEQICLAFVFPHTRDASWRFEWFKGLPVFDETILVCGYHCVVFVVVLVYNALVNSFVSRRNTQFRQNSLS